MLGEGWRRVELGEQIKDWMPLRAEQYIAEEEAAFRWKFDRWVRKVSSETKSLRGHELAVTVPDSMLHLVKEVPIRVAGERLTIRPKHDGSGAWDVVGQKKGRECVLRSHRSLNEAIAAERRFGRLLGPDQAQREPNPPAPEAVSQALERVAFNGVLGREPYDGVDSEVARYLRKLETSEGDVDDDQLEDDGSVAKFERIYGAHSAASIVTIADATGLPVEFLEEVAEESLSGRTRRVSQDGRKARIIAHVQSFVVGGTVWASSHALVERAEELGFRPGARVKCSKRGKGKQISASPLELPASYVQNTVMEMADRTRRVEGWDIQWHEDDGLLAYLHAEERLLMAGIAPDSPHHEIECWVRDDDTGQEIVRDRVSVRWSGDSEKDVKRVKKAFKSFLEDRTPADGKAATSRLSNRRRRSSAYVGRLTQ